MKHRVKWLVKQNNNEILILNKMVNYHKIGIKSHLNKIAKYHKIGIKTLTKQDCKTSQNWHQNSN